MKKYFYYSFNCEKPGLVGNGVAFSPDGFFPLAEAEEAIQEHNEIEKPNIVCIAEISESDYAARRLLEKMNSQG